MREATKRILLTGCLAFVAALAFGYGSEAAAGTPDADRPIESFLDVSHDNSRLGFKTCKYAAHR